MERRWSAEDVAEGGPVALKELRKERRQDPAALRRRMKEARVAMRVRHPDLVAFRGLERALHPDPARRFADAGEAEAALPDVGTTRRAG